MPIHSSYKLQSSFDHVPMDATVSILIDKDTGWWDQTKVEDLFNEDEVKAIKTIPLSCTNQENMMIWRGTTNGLFSVRSAYHLAKETVDRMKAGSSFGFYNSDIWKGIWNLKVPNSEKHFMWRACHDILPTRENLMKRKIASDPLCPICSLEVETVSHILWSAHWRWMCGEGVVKPSKNARLKDIVSSRFLRKLAELVMNMIFGFCRVG